MSTTAGGGKLPETLQWYRDAGNWLVGLSVGALAYLATAGPQLTDGVVSRLLVPLTALLFGVAAFTGVFFYFWLLTFANCIERGEKSEPGTATRNAETWYSRFFRILRWTFGLGALALMIVVLTALRKPKEKPEVTRSFTVIGTGRGCCHRCGCDTTAVLLLDGRTGDLWRIMTVTDSSASLRRLRVDSAAASTRAAPAAAADSLQRRTGPPRPRS